MKANAKIVFNMETQEIMSIVYDDRVLRGCLGVSRMKRALISKVLERPIKDFKLEACFASMPNRFYATINMEFDVHPVVKKIKNGVIRREIPYRCDLFPVPVSKTSDMPFEEYWSLKDEYYNRSLSSRASL